jgi:predicted dehydrogenase
VREAPVAGHIRWGVLGNSGIARFAVIPAIQASRNGSVSAIGSRAISETTRSMKEIGVACRVGAYDDVLADPEIDAVYVPLPNALHLEWGLRAAEAGKATLVEKPMATNAADAARLSTEFQSRRVPLMEAFMYRFHPQHRRVLELIGADTIGDVREVRAHLSVDIMSPVDPANVRFKSELGGGALLDMGCYAIGAARMIYGEEPKALRAWWDIDERYNVDVAGAALLEFGGGRIASVSCSFKGSGQGSYVVIGRKGAIEVPRAFLPGLGTREPETLVIVVDGDGRRKEERIAAVDHYQLMVEAFADAVLSGAPAPLDPLDSIRNLDVIDAFIAAARSDRREPVRHTN